MASIGVNRYTGRILRGWDHGRQSIGDIITTPKLSRVMVRLYGSDMPLLIDMNMNERNLLALYVAIATALDLWEPRYRLTNVGFDRLSPTGEVDLRLIGTWYENGHKGDYSNPIEQTWEGRL